MRGLLRLLPSAALQAWLVFVAAAYVGTLTLGLIDGDDLFTSDDPYLIGIFLGSVAATVAVLFTFIRGVTARPWMAHTTCAVALVLWCGFWWSVSSIPGEGQGIGAYIAAGSGIAALAGWPLFGRRLPNWMIATLTCAGSVLLAAYFVVAARLGT